LFPVTDILTIKEFENAAYKGNKLNENTIQLIYEDKKLRISKIFEIKDKNHIEVRMEIKNLSEISILTSMEPILLKINTKESQETLQNIETSLYEYSISDSHKIFRKGSATKFNEKNYKSEIINVEWFGFRNHYTAIVVKPQFETKGYEIKADNENTLVMSLKLLERNLAPGEEAVYNFSIYAGPQNPWTMKEYGQHFEKIVAFSSFLLIEWIGQAIYHTIPFLHQLFKSWGVAIILVSIMIYGLTYPLTMQSMKSMRKMQEVQPKISALRDRYKDDPKKLNMEMMEIYRREKINPLGGCLPFIIQMPFFMALYQILWRAQYFQEQGFLWIKDLSQPDRLIIFPFQLPFFGNELNILPILTGTVMFLQQKIASKNIVVVDDQQKMQQKMMMYILPVMMTCMFYKFSSSWAVYFLVFYILSTLTQWKISKVTGK
jgi:YidC/Oxa1 family membrane protein insertase